MSVGASVPRSDGETKLRGDATFGVDLEVSGMLHACLLRSPVPAARIVAIDTSGALTIPGVHDVIAAADVPNQRTGVTLNDIPLFAEDYVAYEGEPVAAVLADTPELARRAVEAIALQLDEQQPVATPAEALVPGSRLVHADCDGFTTTGAEWTRGGNVVAEIVNTVDVADAFEEADRIIEDTYVTPRQYQAHLEPKMALATYESGRYTVQVSHQYPFRVRDRLAQILEVPKSAIRIIGHHIGGGFGAKLDVGLDAYACILARRSGRPVKMVNTAAEEMLTAPCRANASVTVRSAVNDDGHILGQDVDVVFDSGAYANNGPALSSIPMFVYGSIYPARSTRVRTRCVYTNTAPTGAFRGVNGPYLVFALERHMDHIADALGVDRRQYRLDSLAADGHRMLNDQPLEELAILREAFDAVESVAPWRERGTGELRGVGIAAALWLTNPMPAHATVKLNEDGSLGVITAATDSGSGAVMTGVRQIAAEGLGLDVDQVVVTMPDTDMAGYDAGSQGSRTTHVVGRAVHDATAEVRQQVVQHAARLLEAPPDDLVVEAGKVYVAGVPATAVPLAQIATTATMSGQSISAAASYATPTPPHDPACASGMLFAAWPTPTYHVHLAEVSVDPVTGQVTVDRYVAAQEVGRAINPDAVRGQIQGGVAQGLGYALWERLDIDDGRYLQRSYETHGLPLACDVPAVEAILLEHSAEAGPYGAKGAAEPPIVPVAAAVANAVADAVGAPIDRLPITPEAVLDALDRAGRR